MSPLAILMYSFVILWIGYRVYGGFFARILGVNAKRETPAHSKEDGIDYVPAKHWLVLFGHHFSSIAGAGPIIGPVIAVSIWGWGPAIVFILLGTIFIGGIHDFGSLLVSLRHGGNSIANVADELISKRARLLFSWFVFFALVVVVAVFVYSSAKTLVVEPKVVVPSLGLIAVAMLIGFFMYRLRLGLVLSTFIGLAMLVVLILLGERFPVALPFKSALIFWSFILLAYAFVASVLPVTIILQPRDYLSSFLLFFGVAVGFIGVLTSRPVFTTPFFIGWNTAKGPLWPMLFVTIACGAISGFHSLVSSGTTSKQLSNEGFSQRISYGGMVMEAVLAVLVVIAIAAGFQGIKELGAAMSKGGPIDVFGDGFGYITRFVLGNYGKFIAIVILNAFILTTLDSATRISRYVLQEIFKGMNRYIATLIIVFLSGLIALTGEYGRIWPIFGSANQLVAALTLLVVTTWLIMRKKNGWITLGPALFMLLTTLAALFWQLGIFINKKNILLIIIDIVLMILAGLMVVEVFQWMKRLRSHAAKGNAITL